ncbi:MAG TPA: hypothetical protein VK539_25890 [Myxococcaceae bacterium]|nr:hypothetical protein [Myxococcaceae bacterium]
MRPLTLCLAVLCAAPALAQDGGYASEGFLFDDKHGPLPVAPLWEDQSGRLIGPGPGTLSLNCYAPDAGGFQFLRPIAGSGILLVGPGRDSFTYLEPGNPSFGVHQVSCSGQQQSAGTITFGPGLEPFVNPRIWPEARDGGYYYMARQGLALFSDTPAPNARLLHTENELLAAMALPGRDGGTSGGAVSNLAMATAPDGTLYFAAYITDAAGKIHSVIFERTPQGVPRLRFSGPLSKTPEMAYSAAFDAVLVDGFSASAGPGTLYPVLAVFPTGGTPGPSLHEGLPPWPVVPSPLELNRPYGGLSGGSAGVLRARMHSDWYRLGPDPTRADFDRDGLRVAEEAQAGTSDFLADFDGDRFSDHAEVVRFHTDPRDAGSAPVLDAGAPIVLAPNYFIRYLPIAPPSCGAEVEFSFAPVVCGCAPEPPLPNCYGPDLAPIGRVEGNALFVAPADGGPPRHVVRQGAGNDNYRHYIIDIVTGEESRHPFPFGGGGAPVGFPLSETKLLLTSLMNNSSYLFRSGEGEFHALIDPGRRGCPILPNAAARCDPPEHSSAPIRHVNVLGYAPELRAVLVSVDSTQGRTLYGVTHDGMLRLADLTSAFKGLPPESIQPLEPAGSSGYLVNVSGLLNRTSYNGTFELDPAFGERPPPRRFVDTSAAGQFFRTGYLDRLYASYLIERGPMSGGPRYLPFEFEVEWEPVRPELQRGEVLAFGHLRPQHKGVVAKAIFNPVTGAIEDSSTFATPGWILWRTTPTGGTVEWLMREEFEAWLSAADRAVLASAPLGAIRSMNASPDGRKLCLAEPAAVRTWELTLDAAGRLERVRLASTSEGVGCAYDDASELVTLSRGPAEVRRGATVLGTVAASTVPIGLYRAGGYWMVQGYLEPLHCVSDAGAITNSGVVVTAMSVIEGGVAYLDDDGSGYTATADDLCQGRGPSEQLGNLDRNLWTLALNRFTYRYVNAVQASMVLRPDGVMIFSGFDLDVSGLGRNPQVVPSLTFHLWPRFAPLSPDKGFAAHQGFRIQQAIADVHSISAVALQAMTIIPGASPSRDWGYVRRPGIPVTPGSPADAGVPDGGPPDDEPEPKEPPCGCASSGPSGPLLALLLALAYGHRRGRRPRWVRDVLNAPTI